MVAVFENKVFKGFWNIAPGDTDWLRRTCAAMGLQMSQVEVYQSPGFRSDTSFIFEEIDGTMTVKTLQKTEKEIDGEMREVLEFSEPIPLRPYNM
jgi:hypothetical protein